MADGAPEPGSSELRETLLDLVGFILALLLLTACVAAPLEIARMTNPWWGLLAALGSFVAWIGIGPRPMPGLIPGIVALTGCAGILVASFVCLIWGIISLFA